MATAPMVPRHNGADGCSLQPNVPESNDDRACRAGDALEHDLEPAKAIQRGCRICKVCLQLIPSVIITMNFTIKTM